MNQFLMEILKKKIQHKGKTRICIYICICMYVFLACVAGHIICTVSSRQDDEENEDQDCVQVAESSQSAAGVFFLYQNSLVIR